ncbi:FAD:protein FMN transferase [Actinomadura fibrosa]|uniref:FAD:protein FMN transferase n=1 Tax=Actinomadura fibrosa TaxID=111802 RepID=A0ABW2XV05_9ACTN|nr:FAD:protein FMN transferase [Actinomadura fibrosa]
MEKAERGTARESFPLWGGEATVMVTESLLLGAARAAVDEVVAAVDLACSTFRTDSELAGVNAADGGTVHVSGLFLDVLEAAVRVAALTGGLVHPAAATARQADWRSIRTDRDAGTVSLPAGMALDLGAVGKAFAADRAAEAAAATGTGVLVALGGDIAMAGPAPADGWRIRVADDHRLGPRGLLPPGQDVTAVGGGLATSSLTVRARTLSDGTTAAHIVDPRTGFPVRGPWRTASVAAATCVDANAASTAALVRGAGAAAWLARLGLPARLVHGGGWVRTVAAWPDQYPDVKVAGR